MVPDERPGKGLRPADIVVVRPGIGPPFWQSASRCSGACVPVLAALLLGGLIAGRGVPYFCIPQALSVFIVMDNYGILPAIGTHFAKEDGTFDSVAL